MIRICWQDRDQSQKPSLPEEAQPCQFFLPSFIQSETPCASQNWLSAVQQAPASLPQQRSLKLSACQRSTGSVGQPATIGGVFFFSSPIHPIQSSCPVHPIPSLQQLCCGKIESDKLRSPDVTYLPFCPLIFPQNNLNQTRKHLGFSLFSCLAPLFS